MPADGRVSSAFGWRRDPVLGVRRFHRGIDIANIKDSRVVAAAGGVVLASGRSAGCGLVVEVGHGMETSTRYCHLDRLVVSAGDRVSSGDTIGLMGKTGRATGCHLHFELIEGERAVDPAPSLWLAFAPE